MSPSNKINYSICFAILFISIIFSIIIGPVDITLKQIFAIITNNLFFNSDTTNYYDYNKIQEMVLLNIRLPRIILACLVGISLSTSGAILQGLFRNPLVDPGFIGVSSGAAVGAMVAIMFSSIFSNFITNNLEIFLLPLLAMLGSFTTTIIVYKISKQMGKTNIMAMLLTGIAINALSGAIIGFFVSFSTDLELRSFTFWTLGGLDNADWKIVSALSFFIIIPFLITLKIREQLDIFMLGDAEAQNLGVNVELLKKLIILLSSIMVGISVSFCGMIGFIGLVTPHLVRLTIGPSHKHLIPFTALIGSIILVSSDLISKIIISPAQLPIGVVTSTIGAPFFIWLIMMQKKKLSFNE